MGENRRVMGHLVQVLLPWSTVVREVMMNRKGAHPESEAGIEATFS